MNLYLQRCYLVPDSLISVLDVADFFLNLHKLYTKISKTTYCKIWCFRFFRTPRRKFREQIKQALYSLWKGCPAAKNLSIPRRTKTPLSSNLSEILRPWAGADYHIIKFSAKVGKVPSTAFVELAAERPEQQKKKSDVSASVWPGSHRHAWGTLSPLRYCGSDDSPNSKKAVTFGTRR